MAKPKLKSVVEFVNACRNTKNNDEVYELFEHGCENDVRDAIYVFFGFYDVSEPTRASLNALGTLYNVHQLIDY